MKKKKKLDPEDFDVISQWRNDEPPAGMLVIVYEEVHREVRIGFKRMGKDSPWTVPNRQYNDSPIIEWWIRFPDPPPARHGIFMVKPPKEKEVFPKGFPPIEL